jgi:hypothetical protein
VRYFRPPQVTEAWHTTRRGGDRPFEPKEILVLFRQATVRRKHIHKADTDNVSIKPGQGNSGA